MRPRSPTEGLELFFTRAKPGGDVPASTGLSADDLRTLRPCLNG